MTDTVVVEGLVYAKLKEFAQAQSPTLDIRVDGVRFNPAAADTFLEQYMIDAEPAAHYAGTNHQSHESGVYQVNVIGPERRKLKAYRVLAWAIRHHFWPLSNTTKAPTLGTSPLVRLGPKPPHVHRHPAPGEGRLGFVVDIYWNADLPRA